MEGSSLSPANSCILTINGGSSSIKFALFEANHELRRILAGRIERIGLSEGTFVVKGANTADNFTRTATAANHMAAVGILMDWIEERIRRGELLAGDPAEVDQSALTGESLPATRNPGEAVFSGSIIRQGEIDVMVYATGVNAYFGKTAQLVQEAHTVSHFQRAVLKIGNYLIVLAAVLVALIIAVALLRGDPILNMLQFALVLTVAAIPVAMPTVLSITRDHRHALRRQHRLHPMHQPVRRRPFSIFPAPSYARPSAFGVQGTKSLLNLVLLLESVCFQLGSRVLSGRPFQPANR